jgi:LysR family transcriptional regulator, flagellar master operon regulator
MNIELAQTFLEIVGSGSLARAADRLHVTHSTVTMRIKLLESILGRRLLIRSKAGVSVTPAGNKFLRHAENLVRAWQLARRQLTLGPGFEELLSIGADSLLWDDLLFDWACRSRRVRPTLAIRCEDGNAEYLVRRLSEGWLDACVVYEAQVKKGLIVEKLFDDPLVFVGMEKRKTREQWDSAFVEIDWDASYHVQDEQHWGTVDETPHLSVTSSQLAIRFLMEFGGTTWLPKRVVENRSFPKPLYILENSPEYTRSAYLVYAEDAVEKKNSQFSIGDLRQSILNVLSGQTETWPEPPKSARRRTL